jgi:hypothetical protein
MKEKLPPRVCGIYLIPKGYCQFSIQAFNDLGDSVSASEYDHYNQMIEGAAHIIMEGSEYLRTVGELIQDQRDMQIDFEADEELLDAIAESTVIPFNKKQ